MLSRPFEVVFGSLLIILGVAMLVLPGPGIPTILVGVTFVSPQHGRRLIWWVGEAWKWLRQEWYARWHGLRGKKIRELGQRRRPRPKK